MVQLTGVVTCANSAEAKEVVNGLLHIPEVKFDQIGNRIEAYYMPDESTPDLTIGNTVKRVLAVLELADEHGFSIIY